MGQNLPYDTSLGKAVYLKSFHDPNYAAEQIRCGQPREKFPAMSARPIRDPHSLHAERREPWIRSQMHAAGMPKTYAARRQSCAPTHRRGLRRRPARGVRRPRSLVDHTIPLPGAVHHPGRRSALALARRLGLD